MDEKTKPTSRPSATRVFFSRCSVSSTGNLNDALMQALAQNGNGNATYIDTFRQARQVLVAETGSTRQTIAKDVKIQIEFNPAVISEYRLIGYETRALNREDFNNDRVDAGGIGAGHSVTALYEVTRAGNGGEQIDPLRYGDRPAADGAAARDMAEAAFLKIRYKQPEADKSALIEMQIRLPKERSEAAITSEDVRFAAAVAAFGQKLKGSHYGDMRWEAIRALAQGARGADAQGYRAEFMQMIDAAAVLLPDTNR